MSPACLDSSVGNPAPNPRQPLETRFLLCWYRRLSTGLDQKCHPCEQGSTPGPDTVFGNINLDQPHPEIPIVRVASLG